MWCEFDDGFELVLLMLPLWPFYTNGERGAIVCLREEEEEEGMEKINTLAPGLPQ